MTYPSADQLSSGDIAIKRAQLRVLLAQRAATGESTARSSVLNIRAQGSGPPLFCVIGGGAGLPAYKLLAEHLDDRQVYGLQIGGATAEDPVVKSIEKMADLHLTALREDGRDGPYILCGHSLAALVALEMAQRLVREGSEVPLLILIDQPGPDIRLRRVDWFYWQWASISRLPWRQRWEYIFHGIRYRFGSSRRLPLAIRHLFYRAKSDDFGADKVGAAEYRRRMIEASLDALNAYRPQPYRGPVALFRAKSGSSKVRCDANGGWRSIATGSLQVLEIPGHHMNIFEPPHVSVFAAELNALCEKVRLSS